MEKRLIYFVGDKPSDVQAAEAIGMRAYPFEEENLMTFLTPIFAWEEGRKLLGCNGRTNTCMRHLIRCSFSCSVRKVTFYD